MALNHWVGMGRLTARPEQRSTTSGKTVISFSVAVDRNSKEKQVDFIPCVAWEKTAEHICRFFDKGRMICVEGTLQTRSWTAQDGSKRSTMEVLVDRAHFTGEKANAATGQNSGDTGYSEQSAPSFEELRDDDLPF